MRFCPYAQRARLVLAHKNIPYETINVHLKRKPQWLFDRNPKGRVPVLEHSDGRIVFESIVVCQYLDEIYPHGRLTPGDPYRKARDRLLADYCEKFMMAIYQLLFTNGESEEAKTTIQKGLEMYEKELNKRHPDGPFMGGDKPAMVDFLIWPWMERLPMFDDTGPTGTCSGSTIDDTGPTGTYSRSTNDDTLDKTSAVAVKSAYITLRQFPRLHLWMEAMFNLPAVQKTAFDLNSHRRFGQSQLTTEPEYDMGLEVEPSLPSSHL